jgi:hypothetical protein
LEAVFSVGSVQTLRLLLHNRPLAEAWEVEETPLLEAVA